MKFLNTKFVKSLDFNTFKSLKVYEIIFVVLMILYIITGNQLDNYLGNYINIFTYMALVILSIILFKTTNYFVAILFVITFIVFLMRSKNNLDTTILQNEIKKTNTLNVLNTNKEKTLEEEIVDNIVKPNHTLPPATYQPVLTKMKNVSEL